MTDGLGIRYLSRLSILSRQSFGGLWTRQKLEILLRYLDSYTTALKNLPFRLIYVDAFAGSGSWQPGSGYTQDEYGDFNEMLKGSPLIALETDDKPFDQLVFIERDPENVESLVSLSNEHVDREIRVINDDANVALPEFCHGLRSSDRAVVFLDPYATEVSWSTVETIARTGKIDCWILFPLMAISRLLPIDRPPDVLWAQRLDRIFGGREHWQGLYGPSPQQSFWSQGAFQQRERGSKQIANSYRNRLETIFARVAPARRVLTNSQNSELFDLFFGASNPRGAQVAIPIANHILQNW